MYAHHDGSTESNDLGRLNDAMQVEVEAVLRQLRQARELQWSRGRQPRDPEDSGRRGKGQHSDPTGEIATDSARLRVRSAVLGSERLLVRVVQELRRANTGLSRAIEQWENTPAED